LPGIWENLVRIDISSLNILNQNAPVCRWLHVCYLCWMY